jgi:hypothetical protein
VGSLVERRTRIGMIKGAEGACGEATNRLVFILPNIEPSQPLGIPLLSANPHKPTTRFSTGGREVSAFSFDIKHQPDDSAQCEFCGSSD